MSAPSASQKSSKQASRWGSLLSGAVAGIESRLDTILAEDAAVAAREAQNSAAAPNGAPTPASTESMLLTLLRTCSGWTLTICKGLSRTSSTRKTDPRLRPPSSRPLASRSQNQSPAPSISRTSIESTSSVPSGQASDQEKARNSLEVTATLTRSQELYGESASGDKQSSLEKDADTPQLRVSSESSRREGLEDETGSLASNAPALEIARTKDELQQDLAQSKDDFEKLELRRQEEVHENLERIDALQAKLQYIAKEVINSARQIASEAPNESAEKRLAEKDERIALLLEEGQKLSKTEVVQSSTIRNLRSTISEHTRSLAETRRRAAKAEKALSEAGSQITRLEASQRDQQARLSRLLRIEKEASTLKYETTEKDSTIEQLMRHLDEANRRADDEQKEANAQALAEERTIAQSLREDLSNARHDFNKRDEKSNTELRKAQEQFERESNRNKSAEMGLQNEITLLESRLEAWREKTEEASAGSSNDSHAKLLRQIETLQSQYSIANENWQGIESSLQARVTALERERDESARQENEARKKARESGNAARRVREQFDETSQRCQVLEHEIAESRARIEQIDKRANDLQKALNDAHVRFERERAEWNASLASRIEEEHTKWKQRHRQASIDSPVMASGPHNTTNRKTSGLDLRGLNVRKHSGKGASELNLANLVRPLSRRSSALPNALPTRSSEVFSPNSLDSGTSTPFNAPNNVPETPSIVNHDQDDNFETGSSPRRTVNDMVSVSTAAAGPSVQLVERMSANVRRLESEKAATKDEMTRLSGQRDEARKEIVALMQEVEQKRALDVRLAKVESDLAAVNKRYQTTLEMLGEKSERVSELEADVADVKKIYKDLWTTHTNTMKEGVQ